MQFFPPMSSSLVNVMTSAVTKASRGLIRDFGEIENLQVSRKSLGNFVSTADQRAEKILIDELTKARPEYNILSEEAGEIKHSDSPYCWIIDPLDGTSNFIHGLPHFSIAIALIKEDSVIVSMTYDPIKDECFWAEKGKGAFLNRRRLRVSSRNILEESVVGIVDVPRSDASLERSFPRTTGIRCMGSCALDLAYVAAGRFDAFVEKGCCIWDISGGLLMVQEAGGYIKNISKTEKRMLHSNAIIASNTYLFKKMCKLFPSL